MFTEGLKAVSAMFPLLEGFVFGFDDSNTYDLRHSVETDTNKSTFTSY